MSAIAARAVGHARAVLVVSLLLALGAGAAATRLPTDAGAGTLVDSGSSGYRATQQVRQAFGEEPVVVLAEGNLQRLVLTANLARLLRLEGCLSGQVPSGARSIPGPCAELARLKPVKSLIGPATFLNEAVIEIDRQLSRLVARVPPSRLRGLLLSIAERYGITSVPSLSNPNFLAALVFDLRGARPVPKPRLAYLFPNDRSAEIVLRLRPDLSEAERHRALGLIRATVYDLTPRPACRFRGRPEPCFALHGGRYVISGVPVVVDALAAALRDALLLLFGVAVAVLAIALLVVFASRMPLLPLAIALAAAALTFGLLEAVGGSLTMASIAVLPIQIGLAVDYAIQLQARYDEAIAAGARGVEAVRLAASRGGPAIATACLATGAGFLALQLSPIPMVRGFGLLLLAGIAIAFLLALTAGFAALSLRREQRSERHATLVPTRLLSLAIGRPRRTLAVGLLLAILGWGLGTQLETQTDIRQLAPQSLPAVRDLNQLQSATGMSGALEVSVRAPDLTAPATLRWMVAFKRRVLSSNGYSGPNPSCLRAALCPGPALSDFVAADVRSLSRREIRAIFAEVPSYDLEKLALVNRRTGLPTGTALLSFGIRAQSLQAQQALIDRVRGEIGQPGSPGGPPPGVRVQLAGLPVIAAAAATGLAASRYWLALAGLVAVALVLLVVYRSLVRALVPLAPTLLASGWAALVLWASGIPLNPMSATLGALTIAIATEFSVILAARFHEERRGGGSVREALQLSYQRTGAAVLASGVTATAGFAVLVASNVTMLRDFGLVTVIDLAVAILGVMLVLPAALVWVEER